MCRRELSLRGGELRQEEGSNESRGHGLRAGDDAPTSVRQQSSTGAERVPARRVELLSLSA